MKLFVAVEPGAEAREYLEARSHALRAAAEEQGLRLRFVRPENLHVTLRFIGEVDGEKAAEIATALASLRATDRLEIAFSGLGAFPNEKRSRVIWAAIREGAEGLKSLAEQVDRCLQGVGIAPEERPYRPHLTLARTRNRSENCLRLMKVVSPDEGRSSTVQEVVLYRSDLGPHGVSYTALARIPLRESSGGGNAKTRTVT